MTPAEIARWIVALGCVTIALAALGSGNLGKRDALSIGCSTSIGAVFCLSHLLGGEQGFAMVGDAVMLAVVCLGLGALFGHAYMLHRAERRSGPSASKFRPTS